MKKTTLLTRFSTLSFALIGLAGCAAESTDEDECLPGDIDCSTDTGVGGKADEFDFKNNPERMGRNLNYRIAELPAKGQRTVPFWKDQYPDAVGRSEAAWADTYWPTVEGSHNIRWLGANVKSPTEKYDAAFNNHQGCEEYPSAQYGGAEVKAEWDRYKACAGPAAKWQSTTHQGVSKLRDGVDNDNDGTTDDEGSSGEIDGLATWWGTCHAWAPAAMLVPEPLKDVTVNGVTFSVGDIKALIQNIYDRTDAVMLGGRCNLKEIKHGVDVSANNECADLNPGALHVVMTNFLGIAQLPLVEDRTANFEIWNQPVTGYEITKQDKTTATEANKCVGATGDTWTFNTKTAAELYDVRMTVEYVTESLQTPAPIGFHNNIRRDRYHYILEVNTVGKIVGGRYCTDSENNHVDFLWSPKGGHGSSNPHINVAKVKELIAKSVAKDGGTGPGKTFTASPDLAIPDNNTTGVSSDIAATGLTGSPTLTVSLDITHTYRGDLLVELHKDGRKVKTLHNMTGGSQQNLVQTFNITAAEVGASPNGTWTLKVSDRAAIDTGKLNKWSVEFR